MDYNNGKIYSIRNDIDDDIYVGSTTQPLSKRFCWHKQSINSKKSWNYLLYQKIRDIGIEHFYIELIENCPCSNKEELRKREGELIREVGTLNRYVAGRNKQEFYIETIEKHKERSKEYYKQNAEELKAYQKHLRETDPQKSKELKRQEYQRNKETYKRYNQTQIVCLCGSTFKQSYRSRHKNTVKHQEYLKSLENQDD